MTMILSYCDKNTESFAKGEFVRAFSGFAQQAYKRLEILAAATSLNDLRTLPSNRLEALRGVRHGQYSIRINEQWRICFEWPQDAIGPSNVEILDYH
jgi:proteic killer suppression protein